MHVTLERSVLLKALSHVHSVVERRNTLPILSNVLIEAEGAALRLMATDLDLQIVESVPASIQAAGATTVSAHTLFDIARKIPDGAEVSLKLGDGKLQVSAARSNFTLPTLPRDDFPAIADEALPFGFSLPAATLRQMIDKTRFAISTEETRYYLNGILLHVTDEARPMLRAVATDGHRLARVAIPRPEGAVGMPDAIVPRKAVAEVRKLLDEAEDSVDVALSPSKIRFVFDNATLTSKLIDGSFPDYSRVIPTANDRLLKLDPKQLAEGVDRVSAVAAEKTRAVKLALQPGKVQLSVTSAETGNALEEIEADYGAEPFDVGFNARYLVDILGQIEGDEVELHMADSAAPTLIRAATDETALYVLMPMRV